MQANKTHISLETAKLLKDCGIGHPEQYYEYVLNGSIYSGDMFFIDNDHKNRFVKRSEEDGIEITGFYPAYTRQEILREYAEEFFGDDRRVVTVETTSFGYHSIGDRHIAGPVAYIIDLLQEKKYQEADNYFRQHCVLIK